MQEEFTLDEDGKTIIRKETKNVVSEERFTLAEFQRQVGLVDEEIVKLQEKKAEMVRKINVAISVVGEVVESGEVSVKP